MPQTSAELNCGMRGLRSDQAHRLFSISGVTLAFCALVLCAAQAMFGYPFRKTIVLNPAKFLPVEGFAYSAPLLRKCSPRGAQSASARLYEDVRVSSLYSQRAKSVIRFGQGIFSFPEKGRLLFSASDNSDPRINGRIYKIEVPHRLSGSVLVICFTALLASVGMHVLMLPNRREALLVWRSRVGRILGPIVSLVGKRPAIVLSIPSIYLFCSFPPLWKDVDALVQLTVPACDVNILHYPPLYSFSGRIPFVVASWIADIGVHRPFRSLFEQQQPCPAGVYFLVVLQHLALIAAMAYTVVSLTPNRILRCVFAVLLASFSSLYTHAHCCGSEALSIPATFVLLAGGALILRGFAVSAWVAYTVALFTAIGSRHLNLLFAIWLPAALVLVGLAIKFGWCSLETNAFNWKGIGVALLVGVAIVELSNFTAKSMIAAFHDEYRSTLGWTLSDRVQSFLDKLPDADRLQLARDLSARTSDPLVQVAIEAHATVGSFYQGTAQVISNELVKAGIAPARIGAERDRIILAATKSYLMTAHPVLLRTIWDDFVRGFVHADNAKIARAPFYAHRYAAFDRVRNPDAWIQLEALPALGAAEAVAIVDAARRDPYVGLWYAVPLGALIICTVLAGSAAWILQGKIPKLVLFGWSAVAVGIFIYFTCMLGVFYLDRYALPLLITILFGLLASVASLWETRAESSPRLRRPQIPTETRRFGVWSSEVPSS
jgi:hypothetical protein